MPEMWEKLVLADLEDVPASHRENLWAGSRLASHGGGELGERGLHSRGQASTLLSGLGLVLRCLRGPPEMGAVRVVFPFYRRGH